VVFGVATEFCVRASALALLRHGFPVNLVVDAIEAITEDGGRQALEEMTAAGVRLITTEDVSQPGAPLT
jgi:nicotinamidase/pyrazinamidase